MTTELATLRRENARLRSEIARRDETIEAMLTISRCIAARVKPIEDGIPWPEIGTGYNQTEVVA